MSVDIRGAGGQVTSPVPIATAGGGRLAAAVAEIEMEEFERVARVVPVFLWLWEHREEVRRLLAQGVTWQALSAALGRLGLVDLGGGLPRQEYCRAAWVRVMAFENFVPQMQAEGFPAAGGVPPEPAPGPETTATEAAPAGDIPPAPPPGGLSPLNAILARGKRTSLTEPLPLGGSARPRRDAPAQGDEP